MILDQIKSLRKIIPYFGAKESNRHWREKRPMGKKKWLLFYLVFLRHVAQVTLIYFFWYFNSNYPMETSDSYSLMLLSKNKNNYSLISKFNTF